MKDKVAEVPGLSDISSEDLEHRKPGPEITNIYRNLSIKKSQTDGYYILLKRNLQSPFRDFESYLRTLTGLNQDDIQLILKQYNSKFRTYKNYPGVYTFKDFAVVLSRSYRTRFEMLFRPDHKYDKSDSILNDSDGFSLITKLTLRPDITALKFNEKSFFNTILDFSSHWDYKKTSHDHEYYSEKYRNLGTIDEIYLKFDVIDGSVLNGVRQSKLLSFVVDKKPGFKVFCEPGTIHFKKINKSVLKTITFYLDDDNKEDVNFNGETLTSTLQMIKI